MDGESASDRTEDLGYREEISRQFIGVTLVLGDVAQVNTLTADLTEDMFVGAVTRWAFRGIRACVERGIVPTPLTVATVALRAGIEPPPVVRTMPVSLLSELAATTVPGAIAPWLRSELRGTHARRLVEQCGYRLLEIAWGADLPDVSVIMQRNAAEIIAEIAAVTG